MRTKMNTVGRLCYQISYRIRHIWKILKGPQYKIGTLVHTDWGQRGRRIKYVRRGKWFGIIPYFYSFRKKDLWYSQGLIKLWLRDKAGGSRVNVKKTHKSRKK